MLSKNTPELDSNGDEVHLFIVSTLAPRLPIILGPNITGYYYRGVCANISTEIHFFASGAFASSKLQGGNKIKAETTPGTGDININLNASDSNKIYKNGSTVQPTSLVLNYVIKY